MRLGIVARMDWGGGLCSQTLNLCKMLKPNKVLLVDSTPFNKARQRPEMYEQFTTDKVMGFPSIGHYQVWFEDLTHILTAETFYNEVLTNHCLRLGIKTFNQPNAEFYSHAVAPPTKFLMPSYWHLEEFSELYASTEYLPPPLFPNDFKIAREVNFGRKDTPRYLHIVGKWASKDRNGTKSLIEALQYTDSEFELVIKSQFELDFTSPDKRITWETGNIEEQQNLYKDFDAMILPRRYGGLCLPMNEALMCGLPVLMTDISPNNRILPEHWLIPANVHDRLQTRIMLDVYNADPHEIATRIDWLCETDINREKSTAFELGLEYAADNLRSKYIGALQ